MGRPTKEAAAAKAAARAAEGAAEAQDGEEAGKAAEAQPEQETPAEAPAEAAEQPAQPTPETARVVMTRNLCFFGSNGKPRLRLREGVNILSGDALEAARELCPELLRNG